MIETTITVAGVQYEVKLEETDGRWTAHIHDQAFPVKVDRRGTQAAVDAGGHTHVIDLQDPSTAVIDGRPVPFHIHVLKGVEGAPEPTAGKHGPIKPPMTGRLEAVLVKEGDDVAQGDVLFVLEAMKMRNEVKAPADGIIGKVQAKAGDAVEAGSIVLELLPE